MFIPLCICISKNFSKREENIVSVWQSRTAKSLCKQYMKNYPWGPTMVFGNCSDPAMCQGLLHWPVLDYGNNQPWVKVRPVRHWSFFLKHGFVSSFFYTAQIYSSLSLKGRKFKVCIFHTQSNLPSDFYYCNIFTGIYICLTDGVQASISICSSFNLWQMKTMKDFGLLRLFSRTGKRIYFIFFWFLSLIGI